MTFVRDVVVVGASAGGVSAIGALTRGWPRRLKVAIVVAFDACSQPPSTVLKILQGYAPFLLRYAHDGEPIECGQIYLGPPGQHITIEPPGVIRLAPSSPFDRATPSTNLLFSSAAEVYGSRVIGIVLTGSTHDGRSGLENIEKAGGIGIVQDPADAVDPTMPSNVVNRDHPHYCVPVEDMVALVAQLSMGDMPQNSDALGACHDVKGRLRHIAIYVEEQSDSYRWLMIETNEESAEWEELSASEHEFDSWIDAWNGGCVAMQKLVRSQKLGPRAITP